MPLDQAPSIFVFTVNFRGGAYVTSSIRKQRASSTRSAEAAAKALAHKLLLHRSIAQRARRAHEAIAAAAIRAEMYGAPEQPKTKGKK